MTETQTPEVVTDAQLAAAAANDGATVAVRRAAEGTVTGTDGQLTVTPARKPRKRPAVKTGNPQADRAARDAETDRNNSVLNGVSTPTPKPAKPRTARQQAARVRNEQIAQAHQPAPVPAPTPEPTAEKRSAKQDLARMVVQAASDLFGNASTSQLSDEDKKTVAQWLHHLPTGNTNGTGSPRWWPENLPRPDRSDWR